MAPKYAVNLTSRDRLSLPTVVTDVLTTLETKNKHPLDDNIVFLENEIDEDIVVNGYLIDSNLTKGGHKYFIKGGRTQTSCTVLAHNIFPAFDAPKVIKGILGSKKYITGLSPYSGMTGEEISAQWAANGKAARDLGTEMHAQIEFLLNVDEETKQQYDFHFPDTNVPTEMEYFNNFCKDALHGDNKLIPHRTEWVIYDEKYFLGGSIDMLFKSYGPLPDTLNVECPDWVKAKPEPSFEDGEERYWIFDWKRSKDLKFSYQQWNQKDKYSTLKGCMLENCDYSSYSVQLNIYRHMIENSYGIRIAGMILVDIHPKHDNYKIYKVPFLDKEVGLILKNVSSKIKPNAGIKVTT